MKTAKIVQMLDSQNNNISPEISIDSVYYETTSDNGKTYTRKQLYPDLMVYTDSVTNNDTSYYSMIKISNTNLGISSELKKLTVTNICFDSSLATTTYVNNLNQENTKLINNNTKNISTISGNINDIEANLNIYNTYILHNSEDNIINTAEGIETAAEGETNTNWYIQYYYDNNKNVTADFSRDRSNDVDTLQNNNIIINSSIKLIDASIKMLDSSLKIIDASIKFIDASIKIIDTSIDLLTHPFITISNETKDISLGNNTFLSNFRMCVRNNDVSSYINVLPNKIDISVNNNKISIDNISTNFINNEIDFTGDKRIISVLDGSIVFKDLNNNTLLTIDPCTFVNQEEKLISTNWIKLSNDINIEILGDNISKSETIKLNKLENFRSDNYINEIYYKNSGAADVVKNNLISNIFINQNFYGYNIENDPTGASIKNIYTTLYAYQPKIQNGKTIIDISIEPETKYTNLMFDSSNSTKYILCKDSLATGWYVYNHIYSYLYNVADFQGVGTTYCLTAPNDVSTNNILLNDSAVSITHINNNKFLAETSSVINSGIYCMYLYYFENGEIKYGPYRLFYNTENTFKLLNNLAETTITSTVINSSVLTNMNNMYNSLYKNLALSSIAEKFDINNVNKNLFITDVSDLFLYDFQ